MPRCARPAVIPTDGSRLATPALTLLLAAGAVAIGWPATAAADMRRAEFRSQLARIDSEFDAAKARCDSFGGNAHDICLAEARGNYEVAKAELEERKEPSTRARYKVRVARAEAAFDVAAEECDEGTSAAKDSCVEEAREALARDKADARKRRKQP
jgi:hypothetical protein